MNVGEDSFSELAAAGCPVCDGLFTLIGECHMDGASICWVGSSFDKTRIFERVDKPGHVAGGGVEDVAEFALSHRPETLEAPEDSGACRCETLVGEPSFHRWPEDGSHREESGECILLEIV